MDNKDNSELIKKRFAELAGKCYERGVYSYTGFLNMMEAETFHRMSAELSYVPYELFGGREDSERRVLRFGSEDFLGYGEPFPVKCMRIEPLQLKFAEELTHRDYLGALMNLGIERSLLGDIVTDGKGAFLYCMETIYDYIARELTRVRRTPVRCVESGPEVKANVPELAEKLISVSSGRADAVISKLYNLSRSDSSALFAAQRVFVNSRLRTGGDTMLKPGDVVSVRGYGKFKYIGVEYVNKKGRSCVKAEVY